MALLGLTFVLYADAEAHISTHPPRVAIRPASRREPRTLAGPSSINSSTTPTTRPAFTPLRGHSLARTLYGSDDAAVNDVPFNGMGRLHYDSPFRVLSPPNTPSAAQDDYNLINYTFFREDRQMPPPALLILRDPECLSLRSNLTEPRPLRRRLQRFLHVSRSQ